MNKPLPTISSVLRRDLLLGALAAFLVTTLVSLGIQYHLAVMESGRLLGITIKDVIGDIQKASDDYMLERLRTIADVLTLDGQADLEALCLDTGISEINIVNADGIIERSTQEAYVGYDMRSGAQSAAFSELLDSEKNWIVKPMEPIAYDPNTYRKYAACKLDTGGFVQIGIAPEALEYDLSIRIQDITSNRHIMESGMVFVLDDDNNIVSMRSDLPGTQLRRLLDGMDNVWQSFAQRNRLYWLKRNGVTGYWMYDAVWSYRILAMQPLGEILERNMFSLIMTVILGVTLFVFLYFGITLLVRRVVVRKVDGVAATLSTITGGNLDAKVTERSTQEFATISDGINATVDALKGHIAREAARIDEELGYARNIQRAAMPALTKQFTQRPEFRLFACMDTAKEVGGDFYDFYMLDAHTLAFLIADVSGKGIPAAMFMMTGKTTLHNSVERASCIGEAFALANDRLCTGNEAGMFITSWMGLLDINTGEVRFANAGHNPPVLIRNGQAEFLDMETDMILGVMDGEVYMSQTLKLQKGDVLFLYTDGVTEAVDESMTLYGEARLLEALNSFTPEDGDVCQSICAHISQSVADFVKDAPQADDMTMLCLSY